jgi:hypothetical protein
VTYATFPLVLRILDVKLVTTQLDKVRKKERQKVYTEIVKLLQSQYDGTDELSEIIARMISSVSLERPMQWPQLITADEDDSPQQYNNHLDWRLNHPSPCRQKL